MTTTIDGVKPRILETYLRLVIPIVVNILHIFFKNGKNTLSIFIPNG